MSLGLTELILRGLRGSSTPRSSLCVHKEETSEQPVNAFGEAACSMAHQPHGGSSINLRWLASTSGPLPHSAGLDA